MALTTLCPQCKAICTIPATAMGIEVACSRCQTVFMAKPYERLASAIKAPAKRTNLLLLIVIGLAVSATLAMVAASFMFFFHQFQQFQHPVDPSRQSADNRGGGFGWGPPLALDPELEEKNPPSEKPVGPALVFLPAPPKFSIPAASDQPVNLQWLPAVDEFVLTTQTWLDAHEYAAGGSATPLRSRTLVQLAESIQAVDAGAQASIRLRYRGYLADASRAEARRSMPQPGLDDLSAVSAFMLRDEKGEPTAHKADRARVTKANQEMVTKVHENQQALVDFFALPMPGLTAARPGAEWNYQRPVPLQCSEDEGTVQTCELTAKLRGVQHGGAGDFALIELRGKFKLDQPMDGPDAKGWALVNAATGIVVDAQAELPFAFTPKALEPGRHIKGTLHITFQRRVPPAVEDNN
jgi:hypothetical protein